MNDKYIVEETVLRLLPQVPEPNREEYFIGLGFAQDHALWTKSFGSMPTIKRCDKNKWSVGEILIEGVDFEKQLQYLSHDEKTWEVAYGEWNDISKLNYIGRPYRHVAIPKGAEKEESEDEKPTRDNEGVYTYFQIELEDSSQEWNTTVCEDLEEVFDVLRFLEIDLDDPDRKTNVIITGMGLTPPAFAALKKECQTD